MVGHAITAAILATPGKNASQTPSSAPMCGPFHATGQLAATTRNITAATPLQTRIGLGSDRNDNAPGSSPVPKTRATATGVHHQLIRGASMEMDGSRMAR